MATSRIFDTGQSWWGALPDAHPAAVLVLFATGVFITDRVNKMPLLITFLGAYFALHCDGVPGRSGEGRGDLSLAGRAGRAVLRVLHPHRSADLARHVS